MDTRRNVLGVALAALILGLPGCGNAVDAREAGRLGVMLDPAGHPVAAVMTCENATPVVQLAQGRPANDDGRTPNVQRGTWTAKDRYAGVESFPIGPAPDGWTLTGGPPGELAADQLFVLTGGTAEDDDAYLQQVSFRLSDLEDRPAGEVRIDGGTLSPAQFAAYECQ